MQNRPGAEGQIAVQALLDAPSGDAVLVSFASAISVTPLMRPGVVTGGDPLGRVAPVAALATDVFGTFAAPGFPRGAQPPGPRRGAARAAGSGGELVGLARHPPPDVPRLPARHRGRGAGLCPAARRAAGLGGAGGGAAAPVLHAGGERDRPRARRAGRTPRHAQR